MGWKVYTADRGGHRRGRGGTLTRHSFPGFIGFRKNCKGHLCDKNQASPRISHQRSASGRKFEISSGNLALGLKNLNLLIWGCTRLISPRSPPVLSTMSSAASVGCMSVVPPLFLTRLNSVETLFYRKWGSNRTPRGCPNKVLTFSSKRCSLHTFSSAKSLTSR